MTNKIFQIDILKEMFNLALSKAADSLSFFINTPVYIQNLSMGIVISGKGAGFERHFSGCEVVAETQLKGDFRGKSYLIFSEEDITSFFKAAHPLNPNAKLSDELSKELLLELDNILSAAVITELANILKVRLYGDVPKLYYPDCEHIKHGVKKELEDMIYLKIHVDLTGDKLNMSPRFIWLIGVSFYNKLMAFTAEEQAAFLEQIS